MPGAHVKLSGSRPRLFCLKRLITSHKPCHVIISTSAYETQFVKLASAFVDWILANGCGNDCVGDHGMLRSLSAFSKGFHPGLETHVNIICKGIPSFSAQWMCAKLGGLAMMASAMKGGALPSSKSSPLIHCSVVLSEASDPVPSPVS